MNERNIIRGACAAVSLLALSAGVMTAQGTTGPEELFWSWKDGLREGSWQSSTLAAADAGFTAAIQQDAGDVTARVYRSITTLLKLAENENLRTLFEEFGGTLDLTSLAYSFASTGTDAPPSNEAVDRTAAELLPAIDAALLDLEAIPANWTGTVEISAADSGFDETVEIDIADVLLAKSALHAARATLQIAQAYDLTVDYGKTDVTVSVPLPQPFAFSELAFIDDPFEDDDFSEWDDIPAILTEGMTGILESAKFARSDSYMLCLLRVADASKDDLDYVYASLWGQRAGIGFSAYDLEFVQDGEIVRYDMTYNECYYYEPVIVLKNGNQWLLAVERDDMDEFLSTEITEAVVSIDTMDSFDAAFWFYDGRDEEVSYQPVSNFLEDHPLFMKEVRDETKLPLAKESLRSALQAAQAAEISISGRTDEAWHFFELTPEQTDGLAEVRQRLSEALASLDAPTRIEVAGQTETVHLGAVFEPAYLTRAMLPSFSDANEIMTGTFADPTFGGVLPNWTAAILEANLTGRTKLMQVFENGGLPAVTKTSDGTATVSVTVQGTPTLRWQTSTDGGTTWTDIPGADSATLALTNLTEADTGTRYRVAAAYSTGTAYSAPTTLKFHAGYLSEPEAAAGAPLATTAYAGFAYDETGAMRGTMTLSAKATVRTSKGVSTTNWTFTAKAVLQNATVSFSAKAWDNNEPGNLRIETRNKELLDVRVEGDRFWGELSGGKVGTTLTVDGARDVFANRKDQEAQERLTPLKGYYTTALLLNETQEPAGYLTLTIGNLGAVKYAGKMKDGTSVSGSVKLLEGLNEDGWYAVGIHKPLYSKKGFMGGLLWLDPEDQVLRVDADEGWFVDWVCADPKKTPVNEKLNVCGGYFGDGKTGTTLAPSYGFSMVMPENLPAPAATLVSGEWMVEALPLDLTATVTGVKFVFPKAATPKKDKTTGLYDYALENPSGLKLTYTARTGLFKGSFKMYYDGLTNRDVLQHKTVTVSYTGVLTPVRDGAFAELPVGLGTGTATINRQKIGMPVYLLSK